MKYFSELGLNMRHQATFAKQQSTRMTACKAQLQTGTQAQNKS